MNEPELTTPRRWALLAVCAVVGALIWLAGPPAGLVEHVPADALVDGVTPELLAARAWRLVAIFAGVILSLMLRPFSMGPLVMLGLVLVMATRAAEANEATAGYGKAVTWLVVAAFLIAGALVRSGLGKRVALYLIVKLGKTTLGLAYAISAADLLLAPVVPSNTARGGGILAPIFRSLASALGSEPDGDPRRAGSFLAFTGAMATVTTSAMFMTAMAANALVTEAAREVMGIEFGWGTWALAMSVPGLCALALMPLIIHAVYPPTLKDAGAARAQARGDLEALGAWSRAEKTMGAVFFLLVVLWATSALHGMGTATVAWIGVLILIYSGTLPYRKVLDNVQTWDALLWLGGLLSMANLLKKKGLIDWFAAFMAERVDGLEALTAMVVLALVYFFAMYGFSMLTAHISAMVAAFLTVLVSVDAPGLASVALFAAFSNVCACLTIYSTGPVVIYFGFGYVPAGQWFRLGALVALVQLVIWLGIGMAWWKLLGWW